MTLQKPVSAAKEENILQTENKMLLWYEQIHDGIWPKHLVYLKLINVQYLQGETDRQ